MKTNIDRQWIEVVMYYYYYWQYCVKMNRPILMRPLNETMNIENESQKLLNQWY